MYFLIQLSYGLFCCLINSAKHEPFPKPPPDPTPPNNNIHNIPCYPKIYMYINWIIINNITAFTFLPMILLIDSTHLRTAFGLTDSKKICRVSRSSGFDEKSYQCWSTQCRSTFSTLERTSICLYVYIISVMHKLYKIYIRAGHISIWASQKEKQGSL